MFLYNGKLLVGYIFFLAFMEICVFKESGSKNHKLFKMIGWNMALIWIGIVFISGIF